MLSWRQRRAVKLLFQKPEEEVAAEVGVRPETIAAWRRQREFREALAAEERNVRSAATRIASDASLLAARNLHSLLSGEKDGKLSLDTLKASGAFEERESEDDGETLADIVREMADRDESRS